MQIVAVVKSEIKDAVCLARHRSVVITTDRSTIAMWVGVTNTNS